MKKKSTTKRSVSVKRKSSSDQKQSKAKKLIAARIREGMEAKNWKPADLVEAMGKDNATLVYTWLSGTHNFTVNSLIALEKALGINLLADGISVARKKRSKK